MSAPQVLAETLIEVTPPEYARFVAHWLVDADEFDRAPDLTGDAVIDALVAAATAHLRFESTETVPPWTEEPGRSLDSLWYVGPDALFPNALVHTPLLFTLHGVLIERDSLVSV